MDRTQYKKDLAEAEKRLLQKAAERDRLDREIAELRQDIGSLMQLAGESAKASWSRMIESVQNMGLTDVCLEVLRAASESLTAAEIKKGLERIGYPVENHGNILASIHTTVRRMSNVEETEKDGKKAYRLKPLAGLNYYSSRLKKGFY